MDGFSGFGSPLSHDVDPSNLVTPDLSKAVSFGANNISEYDPTAFLYSPSQPPFYPHLQYQFPSFSAPDPDTLTPAPQSVQSGPPVIPRKSILKRKKSAAAKSVVSRSTSSGSCKDSSQESIKIESDDDDDKTAPVTKKNKQDSVSVNVLVDLIKSISSLNQNQVLSQPTASALASVIPHATMKCTGPIRELRSAMDLMRADNSSSTKLVEIFPFVNSFIQILIGFYLLIYAAC